VRKVEIALAHVEIGPAAPARSHTDAHLAGSGLGLGPLLDPERPIANRRRVGENLGPHGATGQPDSGPSSSSRCRPGPSRTATPSCSALVSFDPGLAPATT